jgi:hypothetical protein
MLLTTCLQVVLWWEFDKGLCGGRGDDRHFKPHAEAPCLYGSLFWSLLLNVACKLLGFLIKPDGLDDSWLGSWLTDAPSIYSYKYVDEPEAISFRKSTSLHIFRKLNFYGWPTLWAAKMPESVSYGTWMVEHSAGGPWTSVFLQVCAQTTATANYSPSGIWMKREACHNDRHNQEQEHFSAHLAQLHLLGSHFIDTDSLDW